MHDLVRLLRISLEALAELAPYFVIALLIGASVNLFALDVAARRAFKRHGFLGVVFTTCLGAFSPFCSFTVIPLVRKLLKGGVPLSAVMAFWLSSPAIDPPVFALTARAIGLPLALARLIGAIVLSMGTGFVVYRLERRGMFKDVLREQRQPVVEQVPAVAAEPAVAYAVAATSGAGSTLTVDAPPLPRQGDEHVVVVERGITASSCGAVDAPAVSSCAAATTCGGDDFDEDDGEPWKAKAARSMRDRDNWRGIARSFRHDFVGLGKWLLFACVFAAAIDVYVPKSAVTSVLGGSGLLAIPLAVLISVPLYLNGVGAIPIVGGLLAKGMANGAAISFLLGGAVTTIPAMVAVRSVVNNRVFAVYLTAGVVGSTAIGFAVQVLV